MKKNDSLKQLFLMHAAGREINFKLNAEHQKFN